MEELQQLRIEVLAQAKQCLRQRTPQALKHFQATYAIGAEDFVSLGLLAQLAHLQGYMLRSCHAAASA